MNKLSTFKKIFLYDNWLTWFFVKNKKNKEWIKIKVWFSSLFNIFFVIFLSSNKKEFFLDNSGNYLPSLSNQSTLQYLFSTRTKHTNIDEATPILGFGLLQEPCVLIALLHTGIVIDLSVIDLYYLPKIEQLEPIANTTKKVVINILIIILIYYIISIY